MSYFPRLRALALCGRRRPECEERLVIAGVKKTCTGVEVVGRLLLLSDRADKYRRRRKSLTEIDFTGTGYRRQLSESSTYGVVWSRHIHLLPKAEVELTSAECSWARTDPVERASNGDILRVGRSTGASGSCRTRRLGICGSVECSRPSRTAVISVVKNQSPGYAGVIVAPARTIERHLS